MELLETNDPKSELLKRSARQRMALEAEMKLFSDRTGKVLTNSLIIGGALLASYFLVRRIAASKVTSKPVIKVKSVPKKRVQLAEPESEPEIRRESTVSFVLSEIGTQVASHVTAMLLTLAKEKLLEYLAAQVEKKKETDEHS